MDFVCYPKCSTCIKAREWLAARGISFVERDIKINNPTSAELSAWVEKSGLDIKKFFNTSGLLYKSLGLKDKLPQMSDKEKLELLASDGMLVKRPILVTDTAVLVGFREAEWEAALV